MLTIVAIGHKKFASTPEAWRNEWSASAALQAEFRNVETYVAFRKAQPSGHLRNSRRRAVVSSATTPEGWQAEWNASPALQAEFASVADFIALCRAEQAGRVQIWK